jgi:hypothetical protein
MIPAAGTGAHLEPLGRDAGDHDDRRHHASAANGAATTRAGVVRSVTGGRVRDAVLLAFRLVSCIRFLWHRGLAFGALDGVDGAGTPVPGSPWVDGPA